MAPRAKEKASGDSLTPNLRGFSLSGHYEKAIKAFVNRHGLENFVLLFPIEVIGGRNTEPAP